MKTNKFQTDELCRVQVDVHSPPLEPSGEQDGVVAMDVKDTDGVVFTRKSRKEEYCVLKRRPIRKEETRSYNLLTTHRKRKDERRMGSEGLLSSFKFYSWQKTTVVFASRSKELGARVDSSLQVFR